MATRSGELQEALASRLALDHVCCLGRHASTCDEANQLVVALDPDTDVPLGLVAGRLQRPLQKVVRVLESAHRHTRAVRSVSSTVSSIKTGPSSSCIAWIGCHVGVYMWLGSSVCSCYMCCMSLQTQKQWLGQKHSVYIVTLLEYHAGVAYRQYLNMASSSST